MGNRRPNDFGKSYKLCPYCLQNGSSVALNEAILECPASAYVRRVSGLQAYVDAYALGGAFLQSRVLRAYVGGDVVDVEALNQRAATLKQVLGVLVPVGLFSNAQVDWLASSQGPALGLPLWGVA